MSKKFPLLYNEHSELEDLLMKNPIIGTNLGAGVYKIRLASKSKNTGKSGGFRVVTYLVEKIASGYEINLITIYDKSEEANVTKIDILKLI
jgi:hypothetical protein